ncbi:hypothetical protein [Arthrobacter sp. FW306-2-2C-D06B]|jgi:uncharacterized spore protein YtfJ|uniref:hypothetical protein n=1 Tax=Arthrobacter sp. FW306-2-2C-D06B TaxID=2879618 RepID=UPI001F3F5E8B|nr:hypothetical protein [Arthrobacter sp. FW306-2-2C-D06B]UKA58550.1 hypothetical protein LFT47_20165 [Arthrobacter sp. FW306-2-2C-D06B]
MSTDFSSLIESFKQLGVSRAYGAPLQIGGEELIPVALVSFGFGGGSDGGNAAGGGGGGLVLPVGVYGRNASGRVTFQPNTVVVLAMLLPLVGAVGVSIRGVLRALRA